MGGRRHQSSVRCCLTSTNCGRCNVTSMHAVRPMTKQLATTSLWWPQIGCCSGPALHAIALAIRPLIPATAMAHILLFVEQFAKKTAKAAASSSGVSSGGLSVAVLTALRTYG